MKHTPTPWQANGRAIFHPTREIGADWVAEARGPNARANAEFIQRAANAHAALLEACERALQALDQMANGRTFNFAVEDTGCTARLTEALRLARGEG